MYGPINLRKTHNTLFLFRLLFGQVNDNKKATSSTEGMRRSVATSELLKVPHSICNQQVMQLPLGCTCFEEGDVFSIIIHRLFSNDYTFLLINPFEWDSVEFATQNFTPSQLDMTTKKLVFEILPHAVILWKTVLLLLLVHCGLLSFELKSPGRFEQYIHVHIIYLFS